MNVVETDSRYEEVEMDGNDGPRKFTTWETTSVGLFLRLDPVKYGEWSPTSYIGMGNFQKRRSCFSSRRLAPPPQEIFSDGALNELPTGDRFANGTVFSSMRVQR